jgi:hypothetical protein
VLIAGATGAGKGSVLWSLIRSAAPEVSERLVHLWVLDPKGGMELSAGAPLFARFGYDSADDLATLLEEAVEVMNARAARLRGVTRKHTPSVDEPLIVVMVDELASLTAYADRDERRINSALPLLISKGRAVGVVVVGALQDPRKETIPFRDLFPTRIALVEAEQTDLVLGRGARQRGADCSRIPLPSPAPPGCGATAKPNPPGSGPRGSPTTTSPPWPRTTRPAAPIVAALTARWWTSRRSMTARRARHDPRCPPAVDSRAPSRLGRPSLDGWSRRVKAEERSVP